MSFQSNYSRTRALYAVGELSCAVLYYTVLYCTTVVLLCRTQVAEQRRQVRQRELRVSTQSKVKMATHISTSEFYFFLSFLGQVTTMYEYVVKIDQCSSRV